MRPGVVIDNIADANATLTPYSLFAIKYMKDTHNAPKKADGNRIVVSGEKLKFLRKKQKIE